MVSPLFDLPPRPPYAAAGGERKGARIYVSPAAWRAALVQVVGKALRKPLRRADIRAMRQHCAQCLTEVLADGRQTPTGELLCSPCYAALWGPGATDELRLLVERHSCHPNGNGSVATARS
jgi:hypothetical protein